MIGRQIFHNPYAPKTRFLSQNKIENVALFDHCDRKLSLAPNAYV